MKLDVETKQQIEWTEEECFASEAVFVPRPNAVDEDDGSFFSSIICNIKICFSFNKTEMVFHFMLWNFVIVLLNLSWP